MNRIMVTQAESRWLFPVGRFVLLGRKNLLIAPTLHFSRTR
jgi:hypothetical protein